MSEGGKGKREKGREKGEGKGGNGREMGRVSHETPG